VVGSIAYYPWINNFSLGGWMFTIGSAGFLYADLNEWWMNNRVGCAFDSEFRDDFEKQIGNPFYGPSTSCWGQYLRKENGINFAFSAFGSLLYLIGSILFIPCTNSIVLGTYVFIYGSLAIFLSQTWKVYRQGLNDGFDPSNRVFQLNNYSADLPALGIDSCAGLGGLAYMIGSIYFLPQFDTNEAVTMTAIDWFTVGGTFFTLSGVFLLYRYFCTRNYYH
jgi:hypothetical protein